MKELLLLAALYASLGGCKGRVPLNKDLLVDQICNSFRLDTIAEPDSSKVFRIIKEHIHPFMQELSQDSAEALYTFIYLRLQRQCPEFKSIYDRMTNVFENSDWRPTDTEPKSNISDLDADLFFQVENFKYLETNGDTASLHITDSTWQDHFLDGTFSRLSLKKLNKKEFVITYIESNNEIRKNYSKLGDQYLYKILKRNEHNYLMFTQAVGSKLKYTFKLYY